MKTIIRSLTINRKLNGINIFSMALGLVAAGIIFAYVYQEYHYDSGNDKSEYIYNVGSGYAPLAQELKENIPEVENTTRISFFYGYLACSAGENKFNESSAIFADPSFFDLFSFPLLKGNRKECLATPNSVAISEKAAHKYFGSDDPMGKTLKIGGERTFVVDAVYKNFKANSNFKGDLVLPLNVISNLTQIWVEPSWDYESDIHTFALLKDRVKIDELKRKTTDIISKHVTEKFAINFEQLKDIHVSEQSFWDSTPKANVKYLTILLVIACLTLFISSANFLFLFIGIKAQHKVNTGVKKVCGASRVTLFKEYLREVIVQMILSVALAIVIFALYQNILSPYFTFLPSINFFDYKLILILLTITLIVILLAGLYPSIILSSQKPVQIFSSQNRHRSGKVNLINKLVIVQFAFCILFISTTLMMYKQVSFMQKQDTGYAKDELITIPLNMHIDEGIHGEKFSLFAEELKKYPEIKEVTMAFSSPTNGSGTTDWEGKTDGENIQLNWESVSYDYFKTLGVKILQGRTFNPEFPGDKVNWDNHTCAYILNKNAVEAMGLNDPIGKEFEVWEFKGPIIGVVDDYNFQSMRSAISPMFFMSDPFYFNEIIVRVNPNATTTLSDIKKVWKKFVPEFPVDFHFISDQIEALYKPEQDLANTLNLFSILAIVIASMGLFTLTILTMNQRTKEIGIRKVNGAKILEVLVMLNRDFVKWVVIAFVIATPIAYFAMNKWLENFAYKTSLSWWIFALAGLLALGIALLTVSWQSWRAATRNPVEALRYE